MEAESAAFVVLNHNGRRWLDECLSNLARQTARAAVFVADNGSTDGSLDHVRGRFPQVHILDLGRNWGFAEGYNRAVAQVPHDWLALLNNDAFPAPDWLARLLEAAHAHPRAFALGGKLLFRNPPQPGPVIQSAGARFTDAGTAFEIGWGQPDSGQYDQAMAVASVPAAAALISRRRFVECGGFAADYFAYLEDVDYCWRGWLAGGEVWYEPGAVAEHHFGASFGGRASPVRIYWMQRNRLANMVRHLEGATWAAGWLTSTAYDAYRVLEFAGRGQWAGLRALARGTIDAWRGWPILRRQRASLQRRRRMSDAELRARGLMVPALTAFREYRRLAGLPAPAR